MNRRRMLVTSHSGDNLSDNYYLYDTFSTDRAAGAVNGTSAEPVGGARAVTDTNGKISISNGLLSFATGAANHDGVRWEVQTRVLGKSLIGTITPANTSSTVRFGWDSDISILPDEYIRINNSAGSLEVTAGGVVNVGVTTATTYSLAVVMRTNGIFPFIKGGAFANWTLLYPTLQGTGARYPAITVNIISILTADNIRVPKQTYIPVPLQSDGMSNSLTDGLGNPENNGTAGNAYTDIGTWGVAAGVRSCSVLGGGGLGFSYLSTSTPDVIIEANITRTAGNAGVLARWEDANNYLFAYTDGTALTLRKVVAGVSTIVTTGAITYSAGAKAVLILSGTESRLFYNNTAVGTAGVVPSSTFGNHGVFTTDVNATFDNLVIWAKGNEGQHGGLSNL